jgi:hypothetical protein
MKKCVIGVGSGCNVEMTDLFTTPSPIHFKCLPMVSELLWIGATPPKTGGETFVYHFQDISPPNLGEFIPRCREVPKSM